MKGASEFEASPGDAMKLSSKTKRAKLQAGDGPEDAPCKSRLRSREAQTLETATAAGVKRHLQVWAAAAARSSIPLEACLLSPLIPSPNLPRREGLTSSLQSLLVRPHMPL